VQRLLTAEGLPSFLGSTRSDVRAKVGANTSPGCVFIQGVLDDG
jgi:hypothetical protein